MTPLHQVLAIAVHAAMVVVAAGMVVRTRWRLSGFFAAYVGFVLVVNPMFVWWPARFYRQWFYLVLQTGFDVLKFGIALEVGARTFRVFRGTRSPALWAALAILAVTALAAAAVSMRAGTLEWTLVTGELFPRIKAGTIWLMGATLILSYWYHVPVHPYHTALLTSFVAYLGFASALLWAYGGGEGWAALGLEGANALDVTSDLVAACYWAYLTWRPESATVLSHRETLRRLERGVASCG